MKRSICLVLLTVIFVKAAPSMNRGSDHINGRHKRDEACLVEVNIDKQVIENAVASLIFPSGDQKYKDYLSCSYKKQGFQTGDGVILYNVIKEFLTMFYKEEDLKNIDSCKSDVGKSHGDRAFEALECVVKHITPLKEKSR